MEMMMLIVAWGNQEENTVRIVQTIPLACADYFDTIEMHRRIPHKGYGETVACVIPEVCCVNQAPY